MNLIGNSCLSCFITRDFIKESYNNPFCWNVIDLNSFCYLIENYDKMNFSNYELVKDEKWNFSIIIDNKVKVQYVHYKFSKHDSKIRKTDLDVYYNRIWEYIIKKYDERISRMKTKKEEPIFIIGSSYDKSWGAVDLCDIKKISALKTNHKIIVVSDVDLDFKLPDNIIFIKHSIKRNNRRLSKFIFQRLSVYFEN